MLVWIIDEEWKTYEKEEGLLRQEFPGLEIRYSKNGTYMQDLQSFGKHADAVICQISVEIHKALIAGLEKCAVISVYGAGYNNVDLAAANQKGIRVCNVPSYCVEDVSDYVIAAVYFFNKKLDAYYQNIHNGKWGAQALTEKVRRIAGSTLFIVGYGRIGHVVAAKAKALGMRVLVYQAHPREEPEFASVSLEEGLSRADYVTVHVALKKETEHLVNRDFFSRMKKTACFINSSRGKVVDEAALIEAVKKNLIRGAVVDVTETEPPGPDAEILHTKGILVTPHIAYLSEDALLELQETAARNVVDILKHNYSNNIVQPG
jgi:D-3-phosphoglycerate dehydrogenase